MAKLKDVPFEILWLISQDLEKFSMKMFSMVNKQCRAATTPKLFRAMVIEFSKYGLRKLEGLADSPLASHVKVLHYEASELLDPSIQHWDYFTTCIYTPQEYARDQMDFQWDLRGKEFSYRELYLYFRRVARNQNGILQQRRDIRIFSECLPRLRNLEKIRLSFDGAKEDQRLWFANRLYYECRSSFPIHLEAVLKGMVAARHNGVFVESMQIDGMRIGLVPSKELIKAAFACLKSLTLVDSSDLMKELSSMILPSLRRLELENCWLSESVLVGFLKLNGYMVQDSRDCGNEALESTKGSPPQIEIQRLKFLVIKRESCHVI